MDLPSFLTEAYRAPKSVTAPKKMPPISTHRQNRQPAECGGLDGTGDRTGACDGRELVAENGPAVGRHIVLAVARGLNGRGLRLGVDAPLVCQPASVQARRLHNRHDCRDQYDDECVHKSSLAFTGIFALSSGLWPRKKPSPFRWRAKTHQRKDEGINSRSCYNFRVTTLLANRRFASHSPQTRRSRLTVGNRLRLLGGSGKSAFAEAARRG